MPKDIILKEARASVDLLLVKYGEYLLASQKLDELRGEKLAQAAKMAKEKSVKLSEVLSHPQDHPSVGDIGAREKAAEKKLQEISDSMFFDNPVVWMMYKYFAYRGTPGELSTMRDFRAHCSKPDYICTKRFIFVSSKADIAKFSDDAELSSAYGSAGVIRLVEDEAFMADWRKYEYHKDDARVAKWENF